MIWLFAVLMVFAALAVIFRSFWVPQLNRPAAELDLEVYKDQLKAIDDELERGNISDAEAKEAKLEISKRLLVADKRMQSEGRPMITTPSKIMKAGVVLVIGIGSLGLYSWLGSPKIPDQPLQVRLELAKEARANRPNQTQAESKIDHDQIEIDKDYMDLVVKLRATMETRKTDIEGWKLLSLHESRIGNYKGAWRAKQNVIELLADRVSGEDYADLAEYMIVATKGYVSTEAEDALSKALRLDAKSSRARYYSGLALAQNGRPDVAYRMWLGLLEEGPKDAPWIKLIQGQIGAVARAAGINTLNQDAPGPTNQDIEASGQMSETDRQDMIKGMVSGLAERLATEGGTAQEWARLIRAYGVLQETSKANDVWNEARTTFANDKDAMAILLEAARAAEVIN